MSSSTSSQLTDFAVDYVVITDRIACAIEQSGEDMDSDIPTSDVIEETSAFLTRHGRTADGEAKTLRGVPLSQSDGEEESEDEEMEVD